MGTVIITCDMNVDELKIKALLEGLEAENIEEFMNTETLTVLPKGEDFEIIVQHDQTGSAYGITLSKNAYEQLHQHFVVGRSEQLFCPDCKSKARMQNGFIWCENDDCGGIYRAK